MRDIGSLIESAQARGLRLFLAEGKVKVQAPQALDGDTKALIDELREYREEVKSCLNEEDPVLTPEQWYQDFRDLHWKIVQETPHFDYGWLRANRPDIYQAIKDKENEIDGLGDSRLSVVMGVMGEWRGLILRAESERQGTHDQDHKEAKV